RRHGSVAELRRRLPPRLAEQQVNATPTPLVAVRGLDVHLGGRQVLHDVSFEIGRGESFALVGESGSGKSVTARTITGLLGRIGGAVTAGGIEYEGVAIDQGDAAAWTRLRGRRIALVPQASLSSLDPVARVG